MGEGIGWHCNACGCSGMVQLGSGFGSCNNEDVLSAVDKGAYGKLAREIHKKVPNANIVTEAVLMRCDNCGHAEVFDEIYFYDTDDSDIHLKVNRPHLCAKCEEGTMVEVPEEAIWETAIPEECPECGSIDITRDGTCVDWD